MVLYLICYGISWTLARQHVYMLSGLVLLPAAFGLYWKDYRRSGNLIDLKGLFCLSFVGGQAVSCMELSRLQGDWADLTWLCFFLAVGAGHMVDPGGIVSGLQELGYTVELAP